MPPRAPRPLSFVDRHDLWSDAQRLAASAVEREIKRRKLEVIRFAFCDQHGVLRGKTLVASEAANVTGPPAIDGVGPTSDWQGYWQRTEQAKREAMSWRPI